MDPELAGQLRDADTAALGLRIRNRRLALGLTQAALAGDEVTIGYVSRIESGQRRPDAALLETFAKQLKTTPEELITGVSADDLGDIRLSLTEAEFALETGNVAGARQRIESMADLETLPFELQAEALFVSARAFEIAGNYDDAIIRLTRLTAMSSKRQLQAVIALSRCYREVGDLNRAIDVGERALDGLRAAGADGLDEAIQLAVTVAAGYFERGDTGHAVRMARDATTRAEATGSAQARAAAYWNASVFESGRGHTEAAIPLAERALALLGEGNDRRNLARLRLQLGVMLLRLEPAPIEEAERVLKRARRELAGTSAGIVDLVRCDLGLARARLATGDAETAEELAVRASDAIGELAPSLAAEAQAVRGLIAAATGEIKVAAQFYRQAVALLTSVGEDREAAQLWLELGTLLESVGDAEAARDAYKRAAVSAGLRIPSSLHADV